MKAEHTRAGVDGCPDARPDEERLLAVELAVGRMLRVGVSIATTLILLGLAALAAWPAWPLGRSLVTVGLVALVLTPVSRVVAAFLVFLRERDLIYAVFSLTVLLALAAGVLVGKAE